ncbi:hypothetical protein J3Q64DRAFT_1756765 [Phycomyces blakesleeanus]|uniref:F-box domain-containing protein n=2 Tax=Phycomyces blakesleeanus TaxID=4837 RepID=A0A167JSY2_PHYB8|nr:hypothetical protein PHYBLDRAFT_152188 [Phycomyces blakesleeanus NRRL 1555(-)]OAD66639.1 hypothetical protein PHYBLDRAFT_152188 [Phycomyces blakesleeanus NRRL 1555(-)]|eukprot:XP_018284679.1 hypothetical protein PHYBLDRAFT_152188 [Phycomyces blakesleeanus NRRL 1555(-)]
MVSILLPNILSYIATHINKKDQTSCSLVCKRWTEPFLNAYWAKLEIDENKLSTMFATSTLNEVYRKNVHRVWALDLKRINIRHIGYVTQLQQSFPGIKYLFCDEENHEDESDNWMIRSIDWISWRFLTHLSIKLTSKHSGLEDIFMNLSVSRSLAHFTLNSENNVEETNTMLWTQFESLHRHMRQLEYLDINYPLSSISKYDLEMIKTIEPAHKITKITFLDVRIDGSWLCYFALKYPNLLSLNMKPCKARRPLVQETYINKYQGQLILLKTLNQFFPYLKMVQTPTHTCNRWPLYIFYMTLNYFNIKLERVVFDTHVYKSLLMDNLTKCIKQVSESVKIMWVTITDYLNAKPRSRIIFNLCPKLVELHILEHRRIEMEHLLDQCPVLRSLYIENSTTYLINPSRHITIPHSLQKLEFINVSVPIHLFNYISLRCKQLKYLKLKSVTFLIPEWDINGKALFDMHMSQLKTFIIYNYSYCFQHVRHYAIEQLENTDGNSLQHQESQEISFRTNWYHLCLDKTNRKERLLAWELGRRDIEFSQRYYKDFERRKKREKKRKDMIRHCGYAPKRFWKRDLQYGVMIFRFKSVKEYFLDEKREIDKDKHIQSHQLNERKF